MRSLILMAISILQVVLDDTLIEHSYHLGGKLCTIKGDRNPNDRYVYKKELYKSCILIPVLSKSVEKWGSSGRLNICKWTVMEAAIS